jgi:predicted enzyme related to lactoylglutathione lyase
MPNEFDVSVMNTINVDNYDEFAEKIVKAGGKSYTEKRHVPELGVTGSFLDTEGNKFAIIEYKK